MAGLGGMLLGADLLGAGQVSGGVATIAITNVSPALSPSGVALTNPISFEVVGPENLEAIGIAILYRSLREHFMVYEVDAFTPAYEAGSSVSGVGTTTISVTLFEYGGWRDRLRSIRVFGIDAIGTKFTLDVLD